VKDDERRLTSAAEVAMKELKHADTQYTEEPSFNSAKFAVPSALP
jgi:hypothetical protein